jgi:hypothetical protein
MSWLLDFIHGAVEIVTAKTYDYLDCVFYICLGYMLGRIDGIIEFVVVLTALFGFFIAFKAFIYWMKKKFRERTSKD